MVAAYQAGDGTTQTYPVTAAQAYEIALHVVRWHAPDSLEERRNQGRLLATFAPREYFEGCNVGVWVFGEWGDAATVTVVCRRTAASETVPAMTEHTFHSLFERAVEIVRRGEPLPDEPPG